MTLTLHEPKEQMDVVFAVFNGHVNNADQIVRRWLRRFKPNFLARVEMIEREKGGIMGIFDCQPEAATRAYAEAVQRIVNRDRD